MSKNPRRLLAYTNRYERQIILIAFFIPFLFCLTIYILLTLLQGELTKVILYGSTTQIADFVRDWITLVTLSLMGILTSLLIWAYHLSKNLVGAFERIIRELDKVIEGTQTTPITARPNDFLANELLKRINILIKNYKK